MRLAVPLVRAASTSAPAATLKVRVLATVRFEAPVYVGDGAVAEVRAITIKAAAGRHIVKFATKCFTSQGEDDGETLAIDGEAMAFLPTLELSPEPPIAR